MSSTNTKDRIGEKELRDLIQQAIISVEYDYRAVHQETLHQIRILIKTREIAARVDELKTIHAQFERGLKGKDVEFRYVMRPIMAVFERRIAELQSLQTKEPKEEV